MKCKIEIKKGPNSLNLTVAPNNELHKSGYTDAVVYLAEEFDVSKKYIESTISYIKEKDKSPKQISGFYLGNGKFTFSKYLTDEVFAKELVETIFNNTVEMLNKKYLENTN